MPLGGDSVFVRRRLRSLSRRSVPFPSTPSSHPTSGTTRRPGNRMISPRSTNYERLEGGLGAPSRLGIRNIAYRRVVICLAVTVAVVFLLRPSQESVWNIQNPGEPLA